MSEVVQNARSALDDLIGELERERTLKESLMARVEELESQVRGLRTELERVREEGVRVKEDRTEGASDAAKESTMEEDANLDDGSEEVIQEEKETESAAEDDEAALMKVVDTPPLSSIPMSERRRFLVKIIMLIRYTFRGYFGLSFSHKWGFYVDNHMCRKIREFADWIDLRKGDHVLSGHSDYVLCAVLSEDCRYLVSGSYDKSIRVWDLVRLEEIKQWKPDEGYVSSLALRKGLLVSGSSDKNVYVWNARNYRLIRTLNGHTDEVMCVAFSHSGKSIYSGGYDNTLREWSVNNGECLRILTHHSDIVQSVLPLKNCLLSGSQDKSMAMVDEQSGTVTKSITENVNDDVMDIVINCDQSMVAACVFSERVLLYSWPELIRVSTIETRSHSACFHPSNPNILAVGSNTADPVKVYDVRNGECIRSLKKHSDRVEQICFTPNTSHLISVSHDQTIKLWDISDM